MKNAILFIMFCTTIFNLNAQKNNICGKIEYTYTTNLAYLYQEKYDLYFNRNYSYAKEKDIKKVKSKKTTEVKTKGLQKNTFVGRKNRSSQYYYNSINSFYFRDNFYDVLLVVKEKKFKASWKLHSETKNLSNFLCKKATVRFRGRDYIAWYTEEIPVPFGPWKLRNLPGMILEFYDTEREVHVVANKINIGQDNCSVEFDKKELENAMSLGDYLQRKEDIKDDRIARMSSKRPKGSMPFKRDKKCKDCNKTIEIFDEKK